MKLIKTRDNLKSTINLPGSKSYTNRALIIAALAVGKSTLYNTLISDDTKHMINALRQLGIKIQIRGKTLSVNGGRLTLSSKSLFIGNSGTSARFLTALAGLIPGKTLIKGSHRMNQRPIKELLPPLRQLGIQTQCKTGCPPIEIHGGKFRGRQCVIDCTHSSQYLSALLMISPYAQKDVIINVQNLVSRPFVDITLDIMSKFGVKVQNTKYCRFVIKSHQKYNPQKYTIEPDATAASYFLAAPAIVGGTVKIQNINPKTMQGDLKFTKILTKMGCSAKKTLNSISIYKNPNRKLRPITIDMNAMPDVVQTLAVVALFANGTTKIKNIANLRIKETDRIHATASELRKLGANVITTNDSLTITPRNLVPSSINTYDDHRMAMSFAIAGLKIKGIKIKNPTCVNKTFPEFWKTLRSLK